MSIIEPGRLLIEGRQLDANLINRLTALSVTRTMDGAASIDVSFDDHDLAILSSGLLTKPGRPTAKAARLQNFDQAAWDKFDSDTSLTFDGWRLRLAGVQLNLEPTGFIFQATFEDEIATLMRRQHRSITTARDRQTRAQFIGNLYAKAAGQIGYDHYFSPEEGVAQVVKKPKVKQYQKGIPKHAHLTIKGDPITATQRHYLEVALAEADDLNAGDLATLAMLCSGIVESGWTDIMEGTNVPVSSYLKNGLPGNLITNGYGGVLQGRVATSMSPNWFRAMTPDTRTKEQAKSFLKGGRGYQGGGGIALAAAHSDWTPGHIAAVVEGSAANFVGGINTAEQTYNVGHAEAQAILDAWGGVSKIVLTAQRYQYKAGGKVNGTRHNYWDDAGALAKEVNWRLFADRNTLNYVTDDWLFARQPSTVIDKGVMTQGVLSVQANADVGMPIAEVVVTARASLWDGTPGAVTELDGLGPLSGRWLTWTSELDVPNETITLTLHRPAPKKAEPAHDVKSTATTETAPAKGSPGDRIVKIAKRALQLQAIYRYANERPFPGTLFPSHMEQLVYIDCSAFVTLVYKAAKVPDPNGFGYNGLGNTSTLRANGTKTNNPQPGDLVMYGSGAAGNSSHTGVYIGNGKTIEMGGTPGPREMPVHYRPDFAGYWTYDLGK